MASRIKKGDMVEVICGDDKGKRRKVIRVIPEQNKVVVQDVNTAMKHVRPSKKNPQGGRIQIERPIHISNVMPITTGSGAKATRIKYIIDNGKKVRIAKADGSKLD